MTGGINHQFQSGTVIPAQGSLYMTPSVADFRNRENGPGGGQQLFVQEWSGGHLSNFGETVELSMPDGEALDALTYEGSPTPNQLHLRISEVYYNPEPLADDSLGSDQRYEFVELVNASSTETLDLAGVYFSAGIDFQFSSEGPVLLPPCETLVVVAA